MTNFVVLTAQTYKNNIYASVDSVPIQYKLFLGSKILQEASNPQKIMQQWTFCPLNYALSKES